MKNHWKNVIATILFTVCYLLDTCTGFKCNPDRDVCFFRLEISSEVTMMQGSGIKVFAENGKLYDYNVTNTTNAQPIPGSEVFSADGWETPRLLTLIDRQFSGPDIIAYTGQSVFVLVENHLKNEAITIHWHGLDQHNEPWFDGVPYVSHCPISPGQYFLYRFKGDEAGTHWYHSHMGTQRSNGFYGALIIRERDDDEFFGEYAMTIQDYNHNLDSTMNELVTGFYEGRTKLSDFTTLTGQLFFGWQPTSVLINGKGRYKNPFTGSVIDAPLTVFKVRSDRTYRFRVVNAGFLFPFRISVDQHNITQIASDGWDLKPKTVESLVIHPGERYDFSLTTDKPQGNYWIRAVLFAKGDRAVPVGEAILRYKGAPSEYPTTNRTKCTPERLCVVINCPFKYFPESSSTVCRRWGALKAKINDIPAPDDVKYRFFLNFGFYGGNPGVNGYTFQSPTVNALTQPNEVLDKCDINDTISGDFQRCFTTLNLDTPNATVEIIMSALGPSPQVPHPIHIHGHTFRVIKMGYGNFERKTGDFLSPNDAIDCGGDEYCKNPRWSNSSWYDAIPGANLRRPPFKDTVTIPTGGYVVIRFKADNPGLWNVHCHMERHNLGGMRFVINETLAYMPDPPNSLPSCRSYPTAYDPEDYCTR